MDGEAEITWRCAIQPLLNISISLAKKEIIQHRVMRFHTQQQPEEVRISF